MIRDLRPMILDESGVIDAIAHLVAEENERGGLTVASMPKSLMRGLVVHSWLRLQLGHVSVSQHAEHPNAALLLLIKTVRLWVEWNR